MGNRRRSIRERSVALTLMLSAVLAIGSLAPVAAATAAGAEPTVSSAGASHTIAGAPVDRLAAALPPALPQPLPAPVKADVSGTVYGHSKTGTAPLPGVRVLAVNSTGMGFGYGMTDTAGRYKIAGLTSGNYKISYNQNNTSSGLNFIGQYWKNKTTEATANPVALKGTNLSGYNVTLQQSSSISGKLTMLVGGVSTPATSMSKVTTYANGSATGVQRYMNVDAQGRYTITELPAGTYKLRFGDIGATTGLRGEFYNNATTLAKSKAVTVAFGQAVTGINAELSGKPVTSTYGYINGVTSVGNTLSAVVYPSPSDATSTYQWYRNGVALSGATKSQYLLVGADSGKTVSVKTTAAKTGYSSGSFTASAWSVVAPGHLAAGTLSISGTTKVGSTLSAKTGSWSPAPVALSYSWFRNGAAISKATAPTYKVVAADKGAKITVKVTGKKAGYTTLTKTSAATVAVP